MPVVSANAFLELLKKCRLVPADRLRKLGAEIDESPTAKALAISLVKDGSLTKWQAERLLSGNPKLTVGKYELLNQLSAGQTGKVYLARHADMGRHVAIKLLPRQTEAAAAKGKSFAEQAQAFASLDHPHLLHTLDVDSDADQLYLVLEHFAGNDLKSQVDQEGPLECARAADIVRQAAEGLAHAHEKGMSHGELHPGTICVDRAGLAKVFDLGVAALVGPAARRLNEREPASADFAAPEFTGANATPDADVYSLGCIFYFLLTGKPPFDEGTFEERRKAHRSIPPAPASTRRPEVPRELAKICQKMIAKTPANRFGSAQEVAGALSAWLQKNPLPAMAPAPQKEADKPQSAASTSKAPVVAPVEVSAQETPAQNALPAFDFGNSKRGKAAANPKPKPSAEPAPASPAKKSGKKKAAEADAKPKAAKPVNKRLLIGLSVGGGIALLAIVAGAAMFVMGGDDPAEIAKVPAETNTSEKRESTESDEENLDDETLDGDLLSSSTDGPPADAAANVVPETPAASAAETPAVETPSAPPSAAATNDVAGSNNDAQPPAPAPDTPGAAAAPAVADTPPAAAPAEDPAAAPAEDPAAVVPAGDPAAAPASTEVASAASVPVEAPAPAAPQEPFADFKAENIHLPAIATGAEATSAGQSLAIVHDDPEAGCFVRLLGGDGAHKGREIFTLEAADPGFRNRDWTVYVGTGESGEKDRVGLAKLKLDEKDQLLFQWTPEAAAQDVAPFLCNCLLSISVGSASKETPLREPLVVAPLALSLEKANIREQFDVEWAPDPEQLQVEITALEGPFPKFNLTPPPVFKADAGKASILFGDPPNQLMMLEFKGKMQRKFEITATPYLRNGDRPVRFTLPELQRMVGQAQAVYQQMNNFITAKGGTEEQRKQVELELPQRLAVSEQYTDLASKVAGLKDGARIQFRVFFAVNERKVELLKTGAVAEPPEDEKEKRRTRTERAKPEPAT